MPRTPRPLRPLPSNDDVETGETIETQLVRIVNAAGKAHVAVTREDAVTRMVDAEETLRAIGAGEVDAFVVSDGNKRRVFTLATADRPYRMFVENMREGAATLSSSGLILYANRRLAEMLSCSREMIVGTLFTRFVAAGDALGVHEIRAPGASGATFELELIDGDGTVVPVLVGSSPLEVDGDELTCLTFTDLSAQKAQDREIARLGQAQSDRLADLQVAQAALIEQATHDALTGLPNRALLVDRIDQALARARRTGCCTAVYFLDLDHFKHVNDTQGHAVGDTVLRAIADKLVGALRPMDSVARIGGDEFVVLAPDVDSLEHAVTIGARLLPTLSHAPELGGNHRVAASVGMSVSIGGRGTAEILLDEADKAMYLAKSLGGGRVEVYDATLERHVQARSRAREALQSALDDDRIILHYQPVIDLTNGTVAGFEALARITTPDGEILPPSAFIPVAEESGLVVPLGAWVLAAACEEARLWGPGVSGRGLTVAVNLSPRQFQPGDLPAVVRAMLAQSGLDPACLHLELTETAIMDLHPDILLQLGQIRDLGVQIGLDDFGTGYASLSHLRHLPVSFVKIDRSFIDGLAAAGEDERIVSAVVDLAANLGLRSIAEGVETQDQLERLRELGCDQAQGYLFARPLPAADIPTTLERPAW